MSIATATPATVTLTLSVDQAISLYTSIDKELAETDAQYADTELIEAELAATLEDMGAFEPDPEGPDDEPEGHNVIAIDLPDIYDPAVTSWIAAMKGSHWGNPYSGRRIA